MRPVFNSLPASYFSHLHQCIYNGNCNLIMPCIIYLHFSRATYCRVTGRRRGESTRGDRKMEWSKYEWVQTDWNHEGIADVCHKVWHGVRSPCLCGSLWQLHIVVLSETDDIVIQLDSNHQTSIWPEIRKKKTAIKLHKRLYLCDSPLLQTVTEKSFWCTPILCLCHICNVTIFLHKRQAKYLSYILRWCAKVYLLYLQFQGGEKTPIWLIYSIQPWFLPKQSCIWEQR